MRLSHTIAPEEFVLNLLTVSYPQLKSAYVFRWLNNGALIMQSNAKHSSESLQHEFAKFYDKSNTGWYAKHETPIAYKKSIGQISLEGELQRDCLLIKQLIAGKDHLSLLLEFSPFALGTTPYMSSAEKKVIEQSVNGLLKTFLLTHDEDKQILKQIAFSNDKLQLELQDLRDQLEKRNAQFETSLQQLLELVLSKFSKQFGIKINYSPDFIKSVMKYKGSFDDLEQHLSKQIEIEANLILLKEEDEVWLNSAHLSSLKSVKQPNVISTNIPIQLGRLAKAHSLLDRYESSAEKLHQLGIQIIGKHIGAYCDPAISNAAITDALSKNAKKIYELFEKYPERWPIIRAEFRSIANIIEKESLRRQTG